MDPKRKDETEHLKKSWMQHDQDMLRDYLVSEVEDPRLNIQSILTRHFLVNNLFGHRYLDLESAEVCFAMALNWLAGFFKANPSSEDAQALLHALSIRADNANGIEVPFFMSQTFEGLPVSIDGFLIPNYVREALELALLEEGRPGLSEHQKKLFQRYWQKKVARCRPQKVRVLEPACGSANDYRFIDAFGIARLLQYSGFDLCEKNVANARQMFPGIDFQTGNVFELGAPDKSFDLCIVHDLFEHLSVDGMKLAISEICRVTKRALCAGFFNMAEEPQHMVQKVDDYYWNQLSMELTRKLFLEHAKQVQVIHIGTYLRTVFPDYQTHNEQAYTFVVSF